MEMQTIIDLVVGAVLAIIGWFARQLWDAVKNLQEEIKDIEVDLPRNYVTKNDFNESMREIRDICRQIFDKIDLLQRQKVDK
jgi:3-isopropylmalate dehydratase small subunit